MNAITPDRVLPPSTIIPDRVITPSRLTPDELQKAFADLQDAVCDELVSRDDEVHVVLLGFLSGINVYLISDPGVAKTLLWERITMRILEMCAFSIGFSKHTPLDEVVGPQSLSALRNDQLIRKVTGFLPWAHGALLDELPRAAEATATATMGLTNEHTFNQDGRKIVTDLHVVIAAANSLLHAEHEGLEALFDRFPIRKKVATLTERKDLKALWEVDLDPAPPTVLSWGDVLAAAADVRTVEIPDDVFVAACEIIEKAAKQGMVLSNRAWRQSKWVIQARCWLDGQRVATKAHLDVLALMLWDNPDQIAAAEELVGVATSPTYKEAAEYADSVTSIIDDFTKMRNEGEAAIDAGSMVVTARFGQVAVDILELMEKVPDEAKSIRLLNDAIKRLTDEYNAHFHLIMKIPANTQAPFDSFVERHRNAQRARS